MKKKQKIFTFIFILNYCTHIYYYFVSLSCSYGTNLRLVVLNSNVYYHKLSHLYFNFDLKQLSFVSSEWIFEQTSTISKQKKLLWSCLNNCDFTSDFWNVGSYLSKLWYDCVMNILKLSATWSDYSDMSQEDLTKAVLVLSSIEEKLSKSQNTLRQNLWFS